MAFFYRDRVRISRFLIRDRCNIFRDRLGSFIRERFLFRDRLWFSDRLLARERFLFRDRFFLRERFFLVNNSRFSNRLSFFYLNRYNYKLRSRILLFVG